MMPRRRRRRNANKLGDYKCGKGSSLSVFLVKIFKEDRTIIVMLAS
jgi:hypothetical protein